MNFQMFKLDLKMAEEPEIKLPTSIGSSKNQEFQKNIYFCLIDYPKAFDCVDHNKLWKILQEMGRPDNLTCLLRNLYAGQEATVRTGHGKTDWFQIRKGVRQGCILSPCLFNLFIWRVHQEKHWAGWSTSWNQDCQEKYQCKWHHPYGRKWRRTEEPLTESKSEKVDLKLNIQKTKIMASGPITSWQIDGETVETVSDFIFLGSKITAHCEYSQKLKDACPFEGKLWPT